LLQRLFIALKLLCFSQDRKGKLSALACLSCFTIRMKQNYPLHV